MEYHQHLSENIEAWGLGYTLLLVMATRAFQHLLQPSLPKR